MAVEAALSRSITTLARAKINLALHVIGRRADGYHLLDSLVAFADFGDLIHVETAADLSLHLTGPKAADLTSGPDNLVLRAAAAFEAGAKGARITLDKHLPVASGIGGGSADAAAALQALSALWGCPLPKAASVLALGADVPVCLVGRPARMEGIGEKVTPLSLPQAFIVLANPGVGLATASVFAALTRRDNAPLPAPAAWPDAAALAHWLHAARNDLEPPAQALAPVIGTVLAALGRQQGCLLARMSGSGATCFGLFATAAQAEAAAAALARAEAAWWVQAGALAV